ncbi:alpha/beta hydrolase [Microbacterium sp.]|uniref:alpha/beta hydrolase n=1 Tax=Microbacterium sp. TaxID=51671 RepID=UPI0039E6101C
MTPIRRIAAVVATTTAAALVLSGCVWTGIPRGTSSSASTERPPVADGVSADLRPYYEQALTWGSCEDLGTDEFDCTTVRAPRDWSDPDAGDLELALIRHRAEAAEPIGSLLVNPGGPGASGYDLVADSLTLVVGEALTAAYDIVGFDPRGVGRSTAVHCFDAADMDAYLFDLPTAPRDSAQWRDELTTRNRAFVAACESGSDGILPFLTTENAARDLDLLRGVLGDAQLHYLGYSYGTFLGATYAKLFPSRVGRLVLDGAIDPSSSDLDVEQTQAIGFESALRAYMADCLSTRECPFSGTVDDAMRDLGTLLASVDQRPLVATDGRKLGANALTLAIIAALYAKENWSYLTQALDGALVGDPGIAFALVDFYYQREGGMYMDNSTEAFFAYNCMDYPRDSTEADLAAAKAAIAEQAPTIAPYWFGVSVCEVWPYPPTGVREPIEAAGAAPIVVVGTTNDPATPYSWSVALAEQLDSGVLVTREGEGHTGYGKGNSCVDDAVEDYLVDGTVPQDGLVCR